MKSPKNGSLSKDAESLMEQKKTRHIPKMHYIDRICRIAIPITYILFNIVYFAYFLNSATAHEVA